MNAPRLNSLALIGKAGGLEMPPRAFGEFLTLLRGPNGSGKTAVMCSLFWALGGARRVEEPLWSACTAVQLSLTSAGGVSATITREFSDAMRATVEMNGATTSFTDESAFSAALLELLGIPSRTWTARNGGSVGVYMSVLLPAIAIDQDKGWSMPYAPFNSVNFVNDQAEEVSRLLLGIDPKHDAGREGIRDGLARHHEQLERTVEVRARAIESLARDAERAEARDLGALRAARERLVAELTSFDGVVTAFAEADVGMRGRVEEARAQHDTTARQLSSARRQREALDRLMREVEADLDVVGSNEIAAQAFRRYCGNPGCEFFHGRDVAASYGRRVLYLRDQLKDLATALDSTGGRVKTLERQLASAAAHLAAVRAEYETLARSSPAVRISATVDAVTKDLARVASGIAALEQLDEARNEHVLLLLARDVAAEDIRNHDQTRRTRSAKMGEMRGLLQDALPRWLDVLKTNDLGTVALDDALRLTIDGRVLTDRTGPSGSSRLRLVLAFHAARLEAALEGGGHHPGLLLFDAPKQHEIDPTHFAAYIGALRALAVRHPGRVQVVVSSRTEIPTVSGDRTWHPEYPPTDGGSHPWFLGSRQ